MRYEFHPSFPRPVTISLDVTYAISVYLGSVLYRLGHHCLGPPLVILSDEIHKHRQVAVYIVDRNRRTVVIYDMRVFALRRHDERELPGERPLLDGSLRQFLDAAEGNSHYAHASVEHLEFYWFGWPYLVKV